VSALKLDDIEQDRGPWMQLHSGGRFFPLDPRAEDIKADDIANGLALDCRYAGQGRVDRYYSVAEHCVHLASYAIANDCNDPEFALLMLLHDAPEAFINDLNRATKKAVGEAYERIEDNIHGAIFEKYRIDMTQERYERMKDLDRRIVPLEKAAIEPHPGAWHHPWAFDQFKNVALEGIIIMCWSPELAKEMWLCWLDILCERTGRTIEGERA
jgi:hypothetical protein